MDRALSLGGVKRPSFRSDASFSLRGEVLRRRRIEIGVGDSLRHEWRHALGIGCVGQACLPETSLAGMASLRPGRSARRYRDRAKTKPCFVARATASTVASSRRRLMSTGGAGS
jgi:hypothetical protein